LQHLDELDVRILRELGSPASPQWNVRESYATIGRKLGVDEETVRKRVIRAKKFGSLPPWLMKANPRLIGFQAAALDVEVEDEAGKAEALSKITDVEGVVTILDFVGRGLMVVVYYKDERSLNRLASQIGSMCGSSDWGLWKMAFPSPEIEMKRIDWEIILTMADDARMDLQEVANETGVTVRTVQRRLSEIIAGRAVYLSGTPYYGAITGQACHFLVVCPDEAKKRAVDKLVLSGIKRMERSETSSKHYSMFVVHCENPAEASRTLAWLKGLDGVEKVRMGVLNQAIHVQDWLKSEVRSRLPHQVHNVLDEEADRTP
jgi:DNA-binding Lrp family transcriptional regulator